MSHRAPPNPRVYYQGNTMLAELTDLKDEITDLTLSTAIVTAWLVDPAGATVPSSTITLSAAEAGAYRGPFPYTLTLTKDVVYTCIIRADIGNPVQRGEWSLQVIPEVRYA